MPKRDDDPLPVLILDALTRVPFWIGPIAAVVVFAVMYWLAPILMTRDLEQAVKDGGPMNLSAPVLLNGMAGASRFLAPWVGIGIGAIWFCAEVKKWWSRRSPAAVTGSAIVCPECSSPMIPRKARRGPNRGSRFLGCSRWPDCHGTRDI